MPTFKFFNTIHFVYITDCSETAQYLVEKLGSDYIDLSRTELKVEDADMIISNRQLSTWMRLALICHGLKLETLKALKLNTDEKKKTGDISYATVDRTLDTINTFIEHCCVEKQGEYCDGKSLFAAFQKYYRMCSCEEELPIMTFGKRVREALEQKQSGIEYRKLRLNKQKPIYYYCNLSIKDISAWPRPEPEEAVDPSLENEFEQYLLAMNKLFEEIPSDQDLWAYISQK